MEGIIFFQTTKDEWIIIPIDIDEVTGYHYCTPFGLQAHDALILRASISSLFSILSACLSIDECKRLCRIWTSHKRMMAALHPEVVYHKRVMSSGSISWNR